MNRRDVCEAERWRESSSSQQSHALDDRKITFMEAAIPDLAHYVTLREQLVEQDYQHRLHEALNDIGTFEDLDSGYEICLMNSGQIQRALRNLDDAIAGKGYAQDAVFTALNYVMSSLKTVLREEADKAVKSAEEMQFDGRMVA